jgi:hypothetical protein
VVVFDKRHYPGDIDRVRAAFERVDPPEEILVPRVSFRGLGDDEGYVLLNAWNYKGPKARDARAAPSDD